MGSLGDEEDETQPFDSQPSPVHETVSIEDGLETQIMNFEGETQVLQDGLETQVMNFADETQILDDFDGINMDTQLLDECNSEKEDKMDGEESDKTEMFCDTDELLSDNDCVKIAGCSSADWENTTISKQDDKENKAELDGPFYEQASADSAVKMDFTSIRAASIRASGLAARKKALNKSNSELCSSKNNNDYLKEDHDFENNNSTGVRESLVRAAEINGVLENEEMNLIGDESKGRNGNSAARRLFMDDNKFDGNEEPNDNYLTNVNEMDGLSYVDSQEPGDLSQANALEFVDKFLKFNETDVEIRVGIVRPSLKKSNTDSNIKGAQSLAKKSSSKNIFNETGIYEWDDNREDEGGGEFFRRQKNMFYNGEKKGEKKGLSRSRSASKGNSLKKNAKKDKDEEIKKNLIKELDEQISVDFLDENKKDLHDIYNVGPDTQVAAEAMEALGLGLDVTENNINKITKNTRKRSSAAGKDENILSKKYSLRKRFSSSDEEDLRTKPKEKKKSETNLNKELSISSSKRKKGVSEQIKDFDIDKSNFACTPIASRTRQRNGTKQPIAGNIISDTNINTFSYKKGKRSRRKISDNGNRPVTRSSGPETKEKPQEILNVSNIIPRKTRSSLHSGTTFPPSEKEMENRADTDFSGTKLNLNVSPGERAKLSVSTSTTPASCTSSVAAASPICMGDEYLKQSCRKNLVREIDSLSSYGSEPTTPMKESRKRRDMANVRVLFSRHLDDEIIKHQKKILAKLGASVAPSIREATHFVTDKFVRTRNMLEAIAFGKSVVTHLWLEICGQASCCIDEKNYILRDAKKEKEFGFSLPASLVQACQRPLLQGIKVWITPNTKPSVEILSSLVKAVHGLPLERIGRSILNDEKIPDDILALSCEEDYATCIPFLEKGGAVFSSELLLNGIVTQKLEYERHQLFGDLIKKTRSTRWLKRDNDQCLPANKVK